MSGCAHSNDCEMPVSPGELCPVDGVETDHAHEDLEHTNITEFDCEEEAGSRALVKVADPKLPSAEEVEIHNLTHLPYRSWCHHYVRGKGKTMDPRRAGRAKMIPGLHVDYCFMGSKVDATARCQGLRAQVCDGKRGPFQGFVTVSTRTFEGPKLRYYSDRNKFERFWRFGESIGRFEFDFRRRGMFFGRIEFLVCS